MVHGDGPRIEADNTVGQLATLSEELGKVGVNIDGFCATVVDGRGVLHVLVENAGAAPRRWSGPATSLPVNARPSCSRASKTAGYLGEMARLLAATTSTSRSRTATNTRVVFVVPDVAIARGA